MQASNGPPTNCVQITNKLKSLYTLIISLIVSINISDNSARARHTRAAHSTPEARKGFISRECFTRAVIDWRPDITYPEFPWTVDLT